ncbi:hypothetical protein A6302_01936 [Methylobrevis pamukkalensis]|uniref:AsmA family protein n=1 Tax=Methylobrevis pamukkalensis TaxID=1439726 RepID=A0A1E3H4L5_9HYPH|nr:hypothetical protein A6302_01936 [Methylobrevis pamukkalensis]
MTAGGVDVDARLEGGTLGLDRFRVRDLAGAAITASGRIVDVARAPDGRIEASVSVEDGKAAAQLAADLLPESRTAALAAVAGPVATPLRLRVELDARAKGEGTVAAAVLSGTAGATQIETRMAFEGRVDRWRDAASISMPGWRGRTAPG